MIPSLGHRIEKSSLKETLREPLGDKGVFAFLPSFLDWISWLESKFASLKLILTKLQLVFLHLKLNSASQNWAFVGCRKYHVHKSLIIRDFLNFKYSDSFPRKKVPEIPVNLVFTMYLTKCLLYLVTGQKSQVKLYILIGC